jgi:hypothetical protein
MDAKTLRDLKAPPKDQGGPVTALWHAAKGEWDKAHAIVQDDDSEAAAWVHAHLHRVEGDPTNAAYWYRRAGKPVSQKQLDDEWTEIAAGLMVRP